MFTIDQGTTIDFSAVISNQNESTTRIFLKEWGTNLTLFDTHALAGTSWEVEILLAQPGTYQLFAETEVRSFGEGAGSFAFDLQIVPEPNTAVLMGLGMIGLALRPRRGRAA